MPVMTSYLAPLPSPVPIDEALLWTKIGAIGTLASSILSFIAIAISLFSFFYPRRIIIDANLTAGIIMSIQPTDKDCKCQALFYMTW